MTAPSHPVNVRTSRILAAVALTLVVGLLGGCGGSTTAAEQEGETSVQNEQRRCPFKRPAEYEPWELPSQMSSGQVEACQAFFARLTPDKRFVPGSRAFTSSFCAMFVRRDYTTRQAECQDVRVAACRLAVRRGEFIGMRGCLSASPGQRLTAEGSPRVSVVIRDPAVLDGYGVDMVDNTLDRWFTDVDGRISFVRPEGVAWDSRAATEVAVPADLTTLIADSPHVRVVGTQAVRFGGARGTQIDVVARRGDPARSCPISDRAEDPCIPILVLRPEPGEAQDILLSLAPGVPTRVLDLRSSNGRVLIVVDGFSSFRKLAAVERVLRTVEIG